MDARKLLIVSLVVLILAGVALRFVSLDKDITAEESDFVKPALSFAEAGKTNYYNSGQQPNQTGLIHPPMYIYALSVIVSFTTSEAAIRALNVFAILLTAIFIYMFFRKFGGANANIKGLLASSLFLINFYVLSSSLLIDIDAFSTLFVFGFVYFTILAYKFQDTRNFLLSSLFLVLSLSNRYPIAALVYSAIFIYFISNKERRRFIPRYFLAGLLSAVVFLILWAICSTIIEPGNFFTFLKHNASLGGEQLQSIQVYLASFALNVSQIIRLFTLPVVILFILSLFYFRKSKEFPVKLILIYTIASMILFVAVPRPAFGYPRYFLTAMPGVFILISMYIYSSLEKFKLRKEHLLIGALCFVASLLMLIILSPEPALYQANGLILSTNLPDFILNILCISPILIILFRKREIRVLALIALIAALLSYNLYFDSRYALNEPHMKEAGEYLKANTSPSEIILCPKAVGYYAERPFYANDYTKPKMNELSAAYLEDYILRSYSDRKMEDEFFWEPGYFGGLNKPVPEQSVLEGASYAVLYHPVGNLEPEKRIGDFFIYNLSA